MTRDQLLILIIIIVVFVIFVVALCLSYRTARQIRIENARLADLVRNQEQRLQALAQPPLRQETVTSVSLSDDSLMKWIDERMDDTRLFLRKDLDLKTAAREFGLTQKRFSEALKRDERYGSFPEYLTCKRLAYACQLLRHKPYYCIDSIASDAGFRARKTFQTVFKARIGTTPSQYRERCALSGDRES